MYPRAIAACAVSDIFVDMDRGNREGKTCKKKGPSAQEKRRAEVLRAQKESRRNSLKSHRARDLIEADEADEGTSTQGKGREKGDAKGWRHARGQRVRQRRIFWASSVTTPEWMVRQGLVLLPLARLLTPLSLSLYQTDVPLQLNGAGAPGHGWYVRPRPEGRRCLVTACNGITVSSEGRRYASSRHATASLDSPPPASRPAAV